MSRPKASIHVRDVTKTFVLQEGGASASLYQMLSGRAAHEQQRTVTALDGVSFDVAQGERLGIIGRNGSGKTTLLSILASVSSASSGTVEVTGDIHAMLTIGAVLREELSGRENVRLDRAVHGLSRTQIDERIDEIVAFAELGEFIDRPVRTYSSGMKARLAFAMGAFVQPDILIIDETLSVGDAFFAEKATARMREIAADGRIVIVVSHGLQSINDMCTRCIWLDRGGVVMDGEPVAVTTAYQASIAKADDEELASKFAVADDVPRGSAPGCVGEISVYQSDLPIGSEARSFLPLILLVDGEVPADESRHCDLSITIRRVDGRIITRQTFAESGGKLQAGEQFAIRIDLAPMILGADLYRIECALVVGQAVLASRVRVINVVDEEGQFGGRPLFLMSPVITSRRVGE